MQCLPVFTQFLAHSVCTVAPCRLVQPQTAISSLTMYDVDQMQITVLHGSDMTFSNVVPTKIML